MSGFGVFFLIVAVALVALPVATSFKPFSAGVLGVLALTAAAIYFVMAGKSAMTETTAAVFAVGAFMLAGMLAVARKLHEVRLAIEDSQTTTD